MIFRGPNWAIWAKEKKICNLTIEYHHINCAWMNNQRTTFPLRKLCLDVMQSHPLSRPHHTHCRLAWRRQLAPLPVGRPRKANTRFAHVGKWHATCWNLIVRWLQTLWKDLLIVRVFLAITSVLQIKDNPHLSGVATVAAVPIIAALAAILLTR